MKGLEGYKMVKQMKEFKTKSDLYAEYVRLKEKYEPEPVIEKKTPVKKPYKPRTVQYVSEDGEYITAYIKKPKEGKWVQIEYPKESAPKEDDCGAWIKIWIPDKEE